MCCTVTNQHVLCLACVLNDIFKLAFRIAPCLSRLDRAVQQCLQCGNGPNLHPHAALFRLEGTCLLAPCVTLVTLVNLHPMQSSANLAGYSQQDAHEFLITLLDGLHQHLTSMPLQPGIGAATVCVQQLMTVW
jgi:hypothetical protein